MELAEEEFAVNGTVVLDAEHPTQLGRNYESIRQEIQLPAACMAQALGFMQVPLAAPQLILCSLPVFDVTRRTIPTRCPSALVEQRVVADLEPAIYAIPAKHALFVLKGKATGEGFVSFFSKPLHIFRMERAVPKI